MSGHDANMGGTMTENPVAIIRPADRVPGLVDVQVTTGETFYDLTIAQVRYLAAKHGWTVVPAEGKSSGGGGS